MLEEILNELGLDAGEAVMIGDTEFDILMAKNLQMDSIAVSYGVHERKRLLSCAPAVIVDTIDELHQYLSDRVCSFAKNSVER